MQVLLQHERLMLVAGRTTHASDLQHPSQHIQTMCGQDYQAEQALPTRSIDSAALCRRCLKSLRTYRRIYVEFK